MKKQLRQHIIELREAHEKVHAEEKSVLIKEKLFGMPEFKNAKTILFYVDIKGEVKTREMIEEALKLGKTIAVPIADFRTKKLILSEIKSLEELEEKKNGLVEPKKDCFRPLEKEKLELIVVPGIVFDRVGHRIGYSTGFYDRFLTELDKKIPTVGLAFEFQIAHSVPCEPHDVPVKKIITEKRIIERIC